MKTTRYIGCVIIITQLTSGSVVMGSSKHILGAGFYPKCQSHRHVDLVTLFYSGGHQDPISMPRSSNVFL